MEKVVCIESLTFYDYTFKVGEHYLIEKIDDGLVKFYKTRSVSYIYQFVYLPVYLIEKHFISISEFRDEKINIIFDER